MSTTPVPVNERIQALDIIRGFAVLGIFLANVPDMIGNGHMFKSEHSGTDALVRFIYDLFIQMKFYTIFSFLFGLGFYIFMSRAESSGANAKKLFVRRLFILLAFGAAHILLLWPGDVLNTYALIGFLLLLFYRRQTNTLMIWALCLLGLYTMMALLSTAGSFFTGMDIPTLFKTIPDWQERARFLLTSALPNAISLCFEVLPLFLLGIYAGKKGWFQNLTAHVSGIAKWQRISLIVSLVSFLPMALYYFTHEIYQSNDIMLFVYISSKSLAIFYICTLLRFILRFGAGRFTALAAVGRLALTNYISQTVITMLLLRFVYPDAAELPLWMGTVYAALVFTLQIIFSILWLRYFRMGPMEWLWRAGTYGKLSPIRKQFEHAASHGLSS